MVFHTQESWEHKIPHENRGTLNGNHADLLISGARVWDISDENQKQVVVVPSQIHEIEMSCRMLWPTHHMFLAWHWDYEIRTSKGYTHNNGDTDDIWTLTPWLHENDSVARHRPGLAYSWVGRMVERVQAYLWATQDLWLAKDREPRRWPWWGLREIRVTSYFKITAFPSAKDWGRKKARGRSGGKWASDSFERTIRRMVFRQIHLLAWVSYPCN